MGSRNQVNVLGLDKKAYSGKPTTLCVGCGHNSISERITEIAWELGLPMHRVVKFSGIGCSSKTPAYFLGGSHGFNALHGRMPSVATGALVANRDLVAVGVSGDGDSGSIGMGQFKHIIRRNVPMVYVIEDNGVYGLTKGQFSATADLNQNNKYAGGINNLPPIDLCLEALVAGAGFVARGFSGDKSQLQGLLKAAINYPGIAVLDVISPCVTFNDHTGSSKSYEWVQEYNEILNDVTYVPKAEDITVDYAEGETVEIEMHGGYVQLKKLGSEHDPRDRHAAMRLLEESAASPERIITGLIYIEDKPNFHELMNLPETPLVHLAQSDIRPSQEVLAKALATFR